MPELRALIFDVDGTLADTERDGHRVAFNAAFREVGLPWEWSSELYGELLSVTGGKERIRYYVEKWQDGKMPSTDPDALVADLHARKTRHYIELLHDGRIPLRPGVERLLREVRAEGLSLAIATTTTPANVIYLLEANLGQEAVEWFAVIAAGDVVPSKKPAPDIFHYALEHLGLPPEECLAFEDSANGLRATTAAGLRTVITVNDYTLGDDFSGALAVLDHLGEPGMPCTVLHGAAIEKTFVDVSVLRVLSS